MKVLILSCNTGGGHNSCGKYIQEELLLNNIECDFKNYFEIVNITNKDFSGSLYIKSIGKNGGLFKYLYKIGDAYDKTKIKSPVYLAAKAVSNKLYKFIKNNNYDLVICPHLFPALSLTAINKKHHIPFFFVATDYEYHPFTDEINADYYIIPKGLEERFISRGVSKQKLIPIGIPISSRFINEAKAINDDSNNKNILIMLGSMGFGNVEPIIDDLLSIKEIKITVICGSNKKLYDRLKKYNSERLIAIGYTKKINSLIKSSDIVISKPGGLSSTEVASFRKGLIHVFPIPGVETSNTAFFEKHNMSFIANSKDEIIKYTKLLLAKRIIYKKMINNQKKYVSTNSANDFVKFILNNNQ